MGLILMKKRFLLSYLNKKFHEKVPSLAVEVTFCTIIVMALMLTLSLITHRYDTIPLFEGCSIVAGVLFYYMHKRGLA